MQDVVLIGFGAIGQAILQHLQRLPNPPPLRISHVVVRAERLAQVQAQLEAALGPSGAAASSVGSTIHSRRVVSPLPAALAGFIGSVPVVVCTELLMYRAVPALNASAVASCCCATCPTSLPA